MKKKQTLLFGITTVAILTIASVLAFSNIDTDKLNQRAKASNKDSYSLCYRC